MSDDLPKYILGIASLIIIIFVAITKFFPQSQSAVEKTTSSSVEMAQVPNKSLSDISQQRNHGNQSSSFSTFDQPHDPLQPWDTASSSFYAFDQPQPPLQLWDTALSLSSIYEFTTEKKQFNNSSHIKPHGGSNKEKYKKLKNITKISS